MPLRPSVVDVFLRAFNQTPGERSGPTGRLTELTNAIVTHYDPGRGQPSRIKVQQRNGFETLTTAGHGSTTGITETLSWANPELLSAIGSELLAINNAIPRVYDGTDWTHYGAERVVTNRLSEEVFHTSQRVINVPDSAWSNGVTCSVWLEKKDPNVSTVIIYTGFRSDDGAWVRTPQIIYDPDAEGDGIIPDARVIADTEGQYFWVIYNRLVTGNSTFRTLLFDLNGKGIDSFDFVNNQIAGDIIKGAWDISQIPGGGCFHAQAQFTMDDDTDGVTYTALTQSAGTISGVTTNDPDVHCRGKLAWLTNDLGDGLHYLAVLGAGEDSGGTIWGYQVDSATPDPFTHEYGFNVDPDADTLIDSLIGYPSEGASPNQPSLTIGFTSLQTEAATTGPTFDPAFRFSEIWTCTWADVVTFERQNDYTCQVSRAFKHDDEYYSVNYYQSGSGITVASTQVEVSITEGDYMIGSLEQPIELTDGVDNTRGSPQTFIVPASPSGIYNSETQASFAIASPDKVEIVTGNFLGRGVITVNKWTFSGLTATYPGIAGSRLVIAGSSIPTANFTWDIVAAAQDGSVYTLLSNTNGGTVIPGTFSVAGGQTAEITGMTVYSIYELPTSYSAETATFLPAGSMVVTGNGSGVNNGTKTIQRAIVGRGLPADPYGYSEGIWITTGSEVSSSTGFTAVISPGFVNDWVFNAVNFDASLLIGPHLLVIGDDPFQLPGSITTGPIVVNNSSPGDGYSITDVPSPHIVETETTGIIAQVLRAPLPAPVLIHTPADVRPYTFFLQDLEPDYSFIGALLIVTSDTFQPYNNAVFTIVDIDPVASNHIVYCEPTDGRTAYRTQFFDDGEVTITIQFQTNVQPSYQPCWLMVPMTGMKPVVGRWEYGLAYSDWRTEGYQFWTNPYPLHVASVVRRETDIAVVLPYRAISFTVGQTVATASGQIVNASIASSASTVGLKQFYLSDTTGQASTVSAEMLLPGPMCAEFTDSGFHENGVNFGFEAPYVVSQQVSSSGVGLRVGGSYQLVAVAEVTDEDGDRVFSVVSPPLNFRLTGDSNSVTYSGRMLQPLDDDGVPVQGHFGVTNYRILGLSLYRTSYQGDTPTTEHHKITFDLNVNGLAPISDTNDSGFSFTEFTWSYLDENLDASILPAEVLYTDKGYLPRFPAPAQRQGVFWKNRSWVIGYDGAVWMSGEKKEGDATWFFLGFRYVLPTSDKPVALAEMDDYLLVFCSKSIWYIPSSTFPDSTGRSGTLPAPVQLPFTNGCTGHAITLRNGVAYSSTATGVWMITRSLENIWLSQQIQDELSAPGITAFTVDAKQRLFVAAGTGSLFVYDQVVQMWYQWTLPTSQCLFLTTLGGNATFQDPAHTWAADAGLDHDRLTGSPVGIPMRIILSSLSFANVRGLKSVWEMQIVGTYKAPHHLNAVISYPDDDPDNPTTFGPFLPDPNAPYLMAINPMVEQASSYGLELTTDFNGISPPGNSCEIELISCEVGIDSSTGLNKFPNARRIEGS